MTGRLYLVPTPLDFGCGISAPLQDALPHRTIQIAARLHHWICENVRSTRAFLVRVREVTPLGAPLQDLDLRELPRELHKSAHAQVQPQVMRQLLEPALAGSDVGLTSEAGMPAVADPGAPVVRMAHALGIRVIPLVGPVSMLLALAASGLNGQSFAFAGYLPIDATQRATRLRDLEALALKTGQTQVFIEVPHRNAAVLQAMLSVLQPRTRLSVASGLTLEQEHIRSASVLAWRSEPPVEALALPTIYCIGG